MAVDKASAEQYDDKGNAKHYDMDRINSIVKMERIWGTYETMVWAEMTAFKYRLRMGHKAGQPLEQEMTKVGWYEKAAKILEANIGTDEEIKAPTKLKNPQM